MKKQVNFANEFKKIDKGIKYLEKVFLNNLGILFTAREIVLNSFKSNLFPTRNLDEIPTQVPVTEPEVATKPTKVQNNNNF